MVFNSFIILSVAHKSADTWQQLAPCIGFHDRVNSHQLLDLVCCFPLQQLGRFAFCIWTFLCVPPPDSFSAYSYYPSTSDDDNVGDHDHHDALASSSASASSSVDLDDYYYDSHSD